jgi:hypothetical protein
MYAVHFLFTPQYAFLPPTSHWSPKTIPLSHSCPIIIIIMTPPHHHFKSGFYKWARTCDIWLFKPSWWFFTIFYFLLLRYYNNQHYICYFTCVNLQDKASWMELLSQRVRICL